MASNRENKDKQVNKAESGINSAYKSFSKESIDDILKNIDDPKIRQRIIRLFEAGVFDDIVEDVLQKQLLEALSLGYGSKIIIEDGDKLTKKLLTRSWVDDGINASNRIKRSTNKIKRVVADDIKLAIKEGDSHQKIVKSMKRLIDKGDLESDLIRRKITKLSRSTKDVKTMQEVVNLRKELLRGKSSKLKRSYLRFLDAFESQDKTRIEKAVNNAIDKKARYVAERIARSETSRAFTEGFDLRWKNDPDVIGYRWRLSGGHREDFDQCDVYAHADFGKGEGVFPKGKIPLQPAHPNCKCYLTPVFGDEDDDKPFNLKKGDRYVKKLKAHQRAMLMGGKNKELYDSGKITFDKAIKGFKKPTVVKTRIVEGDLI